MRTGRAGVSWAVCDLFAHGRPLTTTSMSVCTTYRPRSPGLALRGTEGRTWLCRPRESNWTEESRHPVWVRSISLARVRCSCMGWDAGRGKVLYLQYVHTRTPTRNRIVLAHPFPYKSYLHTETPYTRAPHTHTHTHTHHTYIHTYTHMRLGGLTAI